MLYKECVADELVQLYLLNLLDFHRILQDELREYLIR